MGREIINLGQLGKKRTSINISDSSSIDIEDSDEDSGVVWVTNKTGDDTRIGISTQSPDGKLTIDCEIVDEEDVFYVDVPEEEHESCCIDCPVKKRSSWGCAILACVEECCGSGCDHDKCDELREKNRIAEKIKCL